jgi:hypothetical protein
MNQKRRREHPRLAAIDKQILDALRRSEPGPIRQVHVREVPGKDVFSAVEERGRTGLSVQLPDGSEATEATIFGRVRRIARVVPTLPTPGHDPEEEAERDGRLVRGTRGLLERDPDCFWRECVERGEEAILTRFAGRHFPAEPAMQVADSYGLPRLDWETILERCALLEAAACIVAEYIPARRDANALEVLSLGGDPSEDSMRDVVEELSPAELFLAALKAANPRGFGTGDRRRWRELENLRDRAQRRLESLQDVPE